MGKSLDDVCNTNLNTPYEEKIRKWIDYIGIDNIKPYIPFTMKTIGKALNTDKNLNNLSIKEWERATGMSVVKNNPPVFIGNGLYRELVKKGVTLMSQSELVSILKNTAVITYEEVKREEERKLQEEKQVEQQKQDMINGGEVILTIVTSSMIIPENKKYEDKTFDSKDDAIGYIGKLKTGFENFDEEISKFDTKLSDLGASIRINTYKKTDKSIVGYEDYSLKTMNGEHITLTWEIVNDYIKNIEKEDDEIELD